MKEGVEKLSSCIESFKDVSVSDRGLIWNTDLIETLELKSGPSCHHNAKWPGRKKAEVLMQEMLSHRDDENWLIHSMA